MSVTKSVDVVSVCNALVDILVHAQDDDIVRLGLNKGIMHLVDAEAQRRVVSHFTGHAQDIELGGSSLNAIRTLAALGKTTVFAGAIGNDPFAERIKSRLHELKIEARLVCAPDQPTGSCFVLVTPDGERTMNTHLGASCMFSADVVPHDEIRRARVFHFSGYQWDAPGQIAAIEAALATAAASDTLLSFDVADPFVVRRSRSAFQSLIAEHADIVFANREEANLLYGSTPEDAAKRIAEHDAIAVIKLGGEGAIIRKGDTVIRVPVHPTIVVDTTGAGDMFAAGFLYGLTSGLSLAECGRIAALLASDVISRVGAKVSEGALRDVRVRGS